MFVTTIVLFYCDHLIISAQVNYECDGWVAHQVSDLWAKTSPDGGDPVWAMWPMGGAWICTHLWEHYTFSLDKVSRMINKDYFISSYHDQI